MDAEYSEYAEYHTDLSRHVVEDGPGLREDQGQAEGWKIRDISDWTGGRPRDRSDWLAEDHRDIF